MHEILSIKVLLDQFIDIKGSKKDVCMILFHGEAHSEYFNGTILPGGVDTQMCDKGKNRTLSARYVLVGKDKDNNECHIFIENQGKQEDNGEILYTCPKIVTDSKILSWMEDIPLIGTVSGEEDCIRIKIYEKEM
jgi:hypothetical protein